LYVDQSRPPQPTISPTSRRIRIWIYEKINRSIYQGPTVPLWVKATICGT
jgi:hypothetical protein